MIERSINYLINRSKKSVLLLGPRQTGKSTLLQAQTPTLSLNLADEEVYLAFASNPGELRQRLNGLPKSPRDPHLVFIDEVQRIPGLLNTVQALVDESTPVRFLLSGSSARKLRRGQANLLPGRIHLFYLGPIVPAEMAYALDTERALSLGTLPGMLTDSDEADARKTLRSYAATYLREEIQAESLSRNLEGFARFLRVVATWSATLVDYTKVASQAMISRQSTTRYFEILEDTLLFLRLDPFAKGARRKLIQHPKICIFDVGVLNGLLDNFTVSPDRRGMLFESLLISQLHASLAAADREGRVSYFRTEGGAEIDLILELGNEVFCVECKSSSAIADVDVRGFESFGKFLGKPHRRMIFYAGPTRREIRGVEILPWQEGLRELGL